MASLFAAVRRFVASRIIGAATLSSLLVIVAATAAIASIPDSEGVIHGCYQQKTGSLRVIDSSAATCRPHEVAIEWNRTGPQGPAGPQGPVGPTGPAGSTGLPVYFLFTGFCGSGNSSQINEYGFVTGTFNSPLASGCVTGTSFQRHRTYTVVNLNGPGGPLAVGTGTATCNPCTVSGRTGSVSFTLTVVGPEQTDSAGNPIGGVLIGGTWTITAATGELAGLTGQGTYGLVSYSASQTTYPGPVYVPNVRSAEVFTGTYSLPS
jgi:hypothetical protein